MAKAKSKAISVVVYIVLLLVFIGAVGAVFHFSGILGNIKDSMDKTFRVELGDKTFTDTNNTVTLSTGREYKFEVKGVNAYSVSVNVENENYSNATIGDVITFFEGYFVVDCRAVKLSSKSERFATVKIKVSDGREIILQLNIVGITLSADSIVF